MADGVIFGGGSIPLTGNADVSDVIKGKTFYTTNQLEKKVGTLELTGNAVAKDVLNSKTFYSINPKQKQAGAMTNNGAVSVTIEPGESYTVPWGYHNGGGKVIASNPFPGYRVRTGQLCMLQGITTTDPAARSMSIPNGCIPICIRLAPTFFALSSKGETAELILSIYDNNSKYYYYAKRNKAGRIEAGSNDLFLCPIGAYGGNVEQAKSIKTVYIRAWNAQTNLISDYGYGPMSVTMWLEPL